jgi:hypothetical protein
MFRVCWRKFCNCSVIEPNAHIWRTDPAIFHYKRTPAITPKKVNT